MYIDESIKSVRKALAKALQISVKQAELQTTSSINKLPEYFISTKVADLFFNRFCKTYKYSFEDQMVDIWNELEIPADSVMDQHSEYRVSGQTRADLVLRSKRGKIRHIVEFKRGIKNTLIKSDALRLASICQLAPENHRVEKNFLIAFGTSSETTFRKRTKEIRNWLDEEGLEDISLYFEPVDLSFHTSKTKRSLGKEFFGGVWQLEYKYK